MIAHDLFTIGVPVLEKVLRTVAVYGGLLVLLRLAGKRDLAQLNSFDLVVLLLLSNVVQNAIIGNDNSLAGGLLGAVVLIVGNAVVVRFARTNEVIDRALEGTPTVLVRDGALDHDALRRLGLRKAEVVTAVRRQGANTIEEVEQASLEPGGTIVVRLKAEDQNASKGDIRRLERKLDRLLAARG
ncbi:MAG TPA: YetF domain-containing protein [Acidimicrobiales bacterium]|nr:YetF domain-containing protein [Acidimicrobiales bacterium]